MDIKLAVSRAGHDKDSIYVIVKEEADWVYLADGTCCLLYTSDAADD